LHRVAALGFNPHKANYYDYENKRFIKHHKGIPIVVHEPEVVAPPHSYKSYHHHHGPEVVVPPHSHSSYQNEPEEIVEPPYSSHGHSSYHHEPEYEPSSQNAVSIAPKSPFYYPQQSFVEESRQSSVPMYQVSPAVSGMYYYHK